MLFLIFEKAGKDEAMPVPALKHQTKIAVDNILIFLSFEEKKARFLISLKNNEKIFMNVVCCSRDRRFKG